MSPSGTPPPSTPPSPTPSLSSLFSGSSGSTTPTPSSSRVIDEPHSQRQEPEEIDLNFADMDLVTYISPSGEHKTYDRNDPDDPNAEEFRLSGSDEVRMAAVEAWISARNQEQIQKSEREENEWYMEVFGVSAAEWKAANAKEQAAKEAEENGRIEDTPVSNMATLASTDESILQSVETADLQTHTTATAVDIGEEDNDDDLDAAFRKVFEEEDKAKAALDADIRNGDTLGSPQASDEDDGGASLDWGSPEPSSSSQTNETSAALASEVHDEDDGGALLDWGSPEPPVDTDSLDGPSKQAAQVSFPSLGPPAASSDKSMTIDPEQQKQTKELPVQIPDTITDKSAQSAKPKRKYKPRAKKADQAPAPDSDLVQITEEELLAELERELGPNCNGCTSLSNDSNASTTNTSLAPGAENESSSSPSTAEGQRPIKPRKKAGKESKAKREEEKKAKKNAEKKAEAEEKERQEQGRQALIEKVRNETLNRRETTSLDRAVAYIQSKSGKNTKEIFIETKLSDTVIHGQQEADSVTTNDDDSVLPKLYHRYWKDSPNYRLLAKHMELQADVKLNDVYISLGLNIDRGRIIYENIQKLLRTPGCSLRINGDLVEEHKILVGERAHDLLAAVGWGDEYFQRPDLTVGENKDTLFGKASWSGASTEIFLGFSKLLYKAAKSDEARRKGLNRRTHVEPAAVAPVEQDPSLPTPPMTNPVVPMATATDPAISSSLPDHATPTPTKRARAVIDLSGCSKGEAEASPNKRPRLHAQQAQQNQNVHLPLQQNTLHSAAPTQLMGTQQHSHGQFQHNQNPQQPRVLPQRPNPYNLGAQHYQNYGYQGYQGCQGYQNPQAVPQHLSPQHPQVLHQRPNPYHLGPQNYQNHALQGHQNPQAMPQNPSPQRPQNGSQYTTPPRPQTAHQYHTTTQPQTMSQYYAPPRPQTMPQHQHQTPQRPWVHLQSQHTSPQHLQLQQGQHTTLWQQQARQQSPTSRTQAQPNQESRPVHLVYQLRALQQAQAQSQQLPMQERSRVQMPSQYLMRPQPPQGVQTQAQQVDGQDGFWF